MHYLHLHGINQPNMEGQNIEDGGKYTDYGVTGAANRSPGWGTSKRDSHKRTGNVGHKNCNYFKIRKRFSTNLHIKLVIWYSVSAFVISGELSYF
jgi:hypothetical protein